MPCSILHLVIVCFEEMQPVPNGRNDTGLECVCTCVRACVCVGGAVCAEKSQREAKWGVRCSSLLAAARFTPATLTVNSDSLPLTTLTPPAYASVWHWYPLSLSSLTHSLFSTLALHPCRSAIPANPANPSMWLAHPPRPSRWCQGGFMGTTTGKGAHIAASAAKQAFSGISSKMRN
jgi:hypothetical protein